MADTLTALATQATERLAQLGAPDTKSEDWRYVKWKPAAELELAASHAITDTDADIVIVDGALTSSAIDGMRTSPTAADCERIATAIASGERADLASVDATFIGIELRGVRATPLRIVHHLTGGESALRIHILAAPGAVADLTIETRHHGLARCSSALNVVCEGGAAVRIDEMEGGATTPETIGVHLASKRLEVQRDASLRLTTALTGGTLVRHTTIGDLLDENAELIVGGATVTTGTSQAHHLVRLNHRVGKARSRQNFKTIADDRSLATFDGIIHVDAGADETDAMQQSNNLQLSPGARIVARPQLDIHTDEVIASHGATIGQPDPEEQRYLRTRGLDADTARSLIVGGFIIAGLAGMGSLRERAQAALLRLLGI
ncbi:MAG: SufD family Fe-S cluster assembly protein [Planctomycetota bacterium]|jgi:Fe-S cluster assembly scaffold protein SufB|nr:SufD family Fe-S cluster assembly protein [Planctomycetota bacterium]